MRGHNTHSVQICNNDGRPWHQGEDPPHFCALLLVLWATRAATKTNKLAPLWPKRARRQLKTVDDEDDPIRRILALWGWGLLHPPPWGWGLLLLLLLLLLSSSSSSRTGCWQEGGPVCEQWRLQLLLALRLLSTVRRCARRARGGLSTLGSPSTPGGRFLFKMRLSPETSTPRRARSAPRPRTRRGWAFGTSGMRARGSLARAWT